MLKSHSLIREQNRIKLHKNLLKNLNLVNKAIVKMDNLIYGEIEKQEIHRLMYNQAARKAFYGFCKRDAIENIELFDKYRIKTPLFYEAILKYLSI